MRRKRNGKKVIVCSVIGAICFGIVSYGHFYRGRIGLGVTFLVLTIAQLVLAVMNWYKGFFYGVTGVDQKKIISYIEIFVD